MSAVADAGTALPQACGSGRAGRALLALLLALCGLASAQVLRPAGPAAERIADLWWVMLAIAAAVCILVITLLLVAIFRRRGPRDGRPPLGTGPFVILGGIVLPVVVLVPLLIYSLGITAGITGAEEEALLVEVVGHQWWWEINYPELGVVTANELRVPADRPVRLRLNSVDVIHSLWVPSLNGKMDLVPGTTNTLWIEAFDPGIYYGHCAEFCGVQHAKMQLLVVAEPEEAFAQWVANQQEIAPPTEDPLLTRGQQVFLSSACVYCHTIQGTNATGRLGPDLTHIATRLTLGAGTIPNNRGNLAGWIVNSQAIKPGNRMPPMYLESADLQALLAYLESLE